MRKYWEVSKIYMKTQLAWRGDVVLNMIFTVTKILFAYLLWGIIFRERGMVGQFTFHGMLSYYIMNSFLTQLDLSRKISEEVHYGIRNGTFSKYIILPINIEKYFVFMEIGIIGFYLVFDFMAAVVWKFVFGIRFSFTHSPAVFICALVMIALGLLFMAQLNYLLGLLTLKYQGIEMFLMIKNNLVDLMTGSLIPLVLFPEAAVAVMRVLPFYYVSYLPAMLLTGQCETEAYMGVAVLAAWCVVIQAVIYFVWEKYIRKYDGAGI